jgi:glutathione S-transferase
MPIELHGYKYSVYAWIARLALHEKGLPYEWMEVDPFVHPLPDDYLDKHPFGRVPVLIHDGLAVYETGAITRYVDEAFEGASLQPTSPIERARMNQVMSIIDSYAYWPLVRQVFSHGVFRPRAGRPVDTAEINRGLEAAPRILGALENLAHGGSFLVGGRRTLADIHLAPMMSYFVAHPRGGEMLQDHSRLATWWASMSTRLTFLDTRPNLPAATS